VRPLSKILNKGGQREKKRLNDGPPLSRKEFQVVMVPEKYARIFAGRLRVEYLFHPQTLMDLEMYEEQIFVVPQVVSPTESDGQSVPF
jgi:hypothetical protein